MPEGELAYGLIKSFNPSDMVGYASHKLVLCMSHLRYSGNICDDN